MSFCVQYGDRATGISNASEEHLQVRLAVDCLGQRKSEHWPLLADERTPFVWRQESAHCSVGVAGDLMWLCAFGEAADAVLESLTGALYSELFALLGDEWRLQRVWHYLPRINEPGAGGLERYRAFCRGRSLAFEKAFGEDFYLQLPAASALGCEGETLAIYACARRNAAVRYLENPLQVPAYRYSQEYGPRAPGFARASLTRIMDGDGCAQGGSITDGGSCAGGVAGESAAAVRDTAHAAASCSEIYLSGTASIRDERSLVEGGVLGQLEITVGNLNRIAAECGLANFLPYGETRCDEASHGETSHREALSGETSHGEASCGETPHGAAPELVRRCFKVYLRNGGDYLAVRSRFEPLLRPQDEVIYLRSDICRAELDLEIEASVVVRGV